MDILQTCCVCESVDLAPVIAILFGTEIFMNVCYTHACCQFLSGCSDTFYVLEYANGVNRVFCVAHVVANIPFFFYKISILSSRLSKYSTRAG